MIHCPKSIKIILWILLGLGITTWIVWFFLPKAKPSSLSSDYSAKIEVVSDIPGFIVKEGDMGQFYGVLKEWEVFGENKFWLRSASPSEVILATPKKIVLHLTDQEQLYNKVFDKESEELIKSSGEKWNGEDLDLLIFLSPPLFIKEDNETLSYFFNQAVFFVLYDRTHSSKYVLERANVAEKYFVSFRKVNKNLPFKVERK